jgi:hypothetical protein
VTLERTQPRGADPVATGAPRPSPRRRTRRSAEVAIAVSWAWTALAVGGTISLLHLVHNRVGGARDALLLWAFFAQVWGLAGAASAAVALLARRLWPRNRNRASGDRSRALTGDLVWALALFHAWFFLPVVLYGRTYDEFAFAGPPRTVVGMVVLIALAVVLLLALTTASSVWLARRLAPAALGGRLARLGVRVAVVTIALHLVLAVSFRLLADDEAAPSSAFRPLRAAERAGKRVVLVGLDGADWRVLRPLLDRGELPTFRRLIAEGATGDLRTLPGANSSVMWASIYTGKSARRHGVLDFYRIRLPGMNGRGVFPVHRTFTIEVADQLGRHGLLQRRIVDRSFLRARPLWEILDDLGTPVGVVDGYLYSVPARRLQTAGSYFFSYALNALSKRPDWDPAALPTAEREVLFQPPAVVRHYAPHVDLQDFHWQAATTLDALAVEGQPDFLNFYCHEPDNDQHWNWKWYQPEKFLFVDPVELEQKREVIPDLYRAFDRFLGELLPRLAPGTTLMVVSDHGHSPTIVDEMQAQHRHGPPGILLLWGDSVRRGVELADAHIYDVTPTVLHLLGLPVGADMDGRVLSDALTLESAAAPARTIPSYDVFGPLTVESGGPDLTEEELERLRALGYL